MSEVEAVAVKDVEKWRFLGKEWTTLEDTPEELKNLALGNFEAFVDGKWRKGSGSYGSSLGPMVWLKKENSNDD